jgi:hypothetical protein
MKDEFISAVFPQVGQVQHSSAAQKIMDALDATVATLMLKVKAKTFLTFRTGLSFCLGSSANEANYCRIDLASDGTYSIRFAKMAYVPGESLRFTTKCRKTKLEAIALRNLFEKETGVSLVQESYSGLVEKMRSRANNPKFQAQNA